MRHLLLGPRDAIVFNIRFRHAIFFINAEQDLQATENFIKGKDCQAMESVSKLIKGVFLPSPK